MKTIAFHNLGCKVNSYEQDLMQQNIQQNNWSVVQFNQKSDVYVINTCSVTNIADRKSRQMIHRAKALNPDAIVVAAGCYVQADAFALAQDESVDLLIGNNRKNQISAILEEYLAAKEAGTLNRYAKEMLGESGEESSEEKSKDANKLPDGSDIVGTKEEITNYLEKTLGNTTILDLKKVPFEDGNISHTEIHTRAYIKIQDGCNRYCSYCIIPYTRGNVRSKAPDDVIKEAEEIAASGVRELVLTGIHISSYGIDFPKEEGPDGKLLPNDPGKHLLSLFRRLEAVPGLKRIRLGSFEPGIITEEFTKEMSEISVICPHFHLSMQSGCDETLKRMNRKYTSEEYAEKVAILRKYFPDAAITTDVIVGFPEETEKEFSKTRDFCKKTGFYEMHVFKYSRRKGTPADANPDQVPEQVKNTRSDILLELTAEQSKDYRKKWLNREVEVLFEEEKEIGGRSYWVGHTKEYVLIALFSPEELENKLVKVVPTEFLTDEILLAKTSESSL